MDVRERLRLNSFFMLSGLILIPILWQCMPEHRWHEGTVQHLYMKYTYRACMLVEFIILFKYKMLWENIIGTIMTILLAPVALMTLFFEYLYRKVFCVSHNPDTDAA